MATFEALQRKQPNVRPFVLGRAFYLGSNRYGTIWTGDNSASWEHLAASLTMVLSVSIGGFSFCGADIGGYKGSPSEELLVRWYQFAVFYPFFRGHSDMISPRREPWLFTTETNNRIRNAIHMRYQILPYLYTIFFEHVQYGTPMWKPLFYEYQNVPQEFIDKEIIVGHDILVIPVLEPTDQIKIYLPEQTKWYSFYDHKIINSGNTQADVDLDKIGILIKEGAIIPKFERLRRSSKLMRIADPYSFEVYLNSNQEANGFLYIDDGESWDYVNKKEYLLKNVTFNKNDGISLKNIHAGFAPNNKIERITIIGYENSEKVKKVLIKSKENQEIENNARIVILQNGDIEIQKINLFISREYIIKLIEN